MEGGCSQTLPWPSLSGLCTSLGEKSSFLGQGMALILHVGWLWASLRCWSPGEDRGDVPRGMGQAVAGGGSSPASSLASWQVSLHHPGAPAPRGLPLGERACGNKHGGWEGGEGWQLACPELLLKGT